MYSASLVSVKRTSSRTKATCITSVLSILAVSLGFCSPLMAQDAASAESVVAEHKSQPEVFLFPDPGAAADRSRFSDAELVHFGLPPRPDSEQSPELFARWQRMLSTPQTRIADPKLVMTSIAAGPAKNMEITGAAGGAVSAKSDNWSGYAMIAKAGKFNLNNTTVSAEYFVPRAQEAFGSCSNNWDYAFQWVGIDGYNSDDVLQAGTEADVACSGGKATTFYSAWYEWFPFLETRISGLPIAPGDMMGVQVWYTTAAPHGHAYVLDYSTKQSVTVAFNPPTGIKLVGDSVEWIVERPTVGGALPDLTNYVADGFNYAYAYQGSKYFYPGAPASGTTAYKITMYCSPWPTPSSACTTNAPISYANLYGEYSLWFYDEKAAY